MRLIRNLLAGSVLVLGGILPLGAAALAAGPMPASPVGTSNVVDVRVVCDLTGCFDTRRPPPGYEQPPQRGYDERQSDGYNDPPRHRPPGYGDIPPPPPPGYRRPPPPPPPGYGRRPDRRHIEWCLDRYRSYEPRSNTYIDRNGRERSCRSPWS
ncbi:MAG: BA14K family protein [Allorhizobium sp.]